MSSEQPTVTLIDRRGQLDELIARDLIKKISGLWELLDQKGATLPNIQEMGSNSGFKAYQPLTKREPGTQEQPENQEESFQISQECYQKISYNILVRKGANTARMQLFVPPNKGSRGWDLTFTNKPLINEMLGIKEKETPADQLAQQEIELANKLLEYYKNLVIDPQSQVVDLSAIPPGPGMIIRRDS